MVLRLIFVAFICLVPLKKVCAGTVTFLHDENIEVKLQDAAYPNYLTYSALFNYPGTTIFHLTETSIHLYSLKFNSKEYYLWIGDPTLHIQIDLTDSEIRTTDFLLISKNNWHTGEIDSNIEGLKKLNEIDIYYKNALDSLNNLAQTNDQFRNENSFNTITWDSRSAKRLYNIAIESFSYQFDENIFHYIPQYANYWQLLYKLYYQYYHTHSFKGLNKKEIKSKIESDFSPPQSQLLAFHHFFNAGLSLNDLKENFELFKASLSDREKVLVKALIQNKAVKNLSYSPQIYFLFGIDIDAAMESYFARDSSEKNHLIVFWSVWDKSMETEFSLLNDLKDDFNKEYKFVHICIDAYETPEKTKAFIYRNRVGGFHLLPEQSKAFRNSIYRKDLKIRSFPFYVLTNKQGEVIENESVPLGISDRLASKMRFFSTKK